MRRASRPAAVALVVATALATLAAPASATRRARGVVDLGPTPGRTAVTVTVALRLPGQDALAAFLAAQAGSVTPVHLSAAEIGARFGLPAARVDAVAARLAAAGVHVTERYEQRTAVVATGTAAALERFFTVRLHEYRGGDGARYRAPTRAPRIPSDLADAVLDVQGLDTRPVFAPTSRAAQTGGESATFVTPQQLAHIYGGDPLTQAGMNGSGQTIAVASLATAHGDEFPAWAKRFRSSTTPTQTITVRPSAPTFKQHNWDADAAGEVALDLEMTRAMAPKATILNYTTQNDGLGLERILSQVVQDHKATIVSISYGSCELHRDAAAVAANENSFMAAQAAGIDVFASSGDSGPFGCSDPKRAAPTDSRKSVSYPASSAFVTAVGGTTLIATGSNLREEGWQEPTSVAGSGGGRSVDIARPPWQTAAIVHDPGTKRLVPDVAGPSSPSFNLAIAAFQGGKVVFEIGGGTSAAAPFWAGGTALIKQFVHTKEPSFPDGNLTPLLYRIGGDPTTYAGAFHDVTSGSNQDFSAGSGWDFMTGLGSPNLGGLATALDALVHAGTR